MQSNIWMTVPSVCPAPLSSMHLLAATPEMIGPVVVLGTNGRTETSAMAPLNGLLWASPLK
ncbi:hypothetical protein P3T36_001698 [Kitasatospora sp. MAP12-15]|uniref:hypothetical protein n=1 Tax=unclassified Kitasatospora TaxID=2633591 RepID=UPI002475D926|nr:hypothetical protein [Kitasatospora sp. MAP12-44]MDH6113423.1 hypothetical protein [Kitasatospora sp. MAP12-44]